MKFLKDIAAKLDRYTVAKSAIVLGIATAAIFTGVASSALAFSVGAVAASAAVYAATKVPSMFSAIKSFFSSKKEEEKEEKPALRRSPRLAEKNKTVIDLDAAFGASAVAAVYAATKVPSMLFSAIKSFFSSKKEEKPALRRSARLAEKNKTVIERNDLDAPKQEAEKVAEEAVANKSAKTVRFDIKRETTNNKNAVASAAVETPPAVEAPADVVRSKRLAHFK